MKLIVFGYKRHGKDTACKYLQRRYDLKYTASSAYACDTFLYDQLKGRFGYKSKRQCFEDRVNHSQLWYEAIREYNANDRARMGREIFSVHSVYCGIRDREEFEALRAAGLFDLAVWIDASDRLPPEDTDSMNVTIDDADVVISNNHGLLDLYRSLDAFVEGLALAPAAVKKAG